MPAKTRRRPPSPASSRAERDAPRAGYVAILKVIAEIPRGKVATYGQVAWLAGLPGRARLVGHVLGEPRAAAVAWHRVINAQGKIALPLNSPGQIEQRRRLRDEGVFFRGGRIDLRRHQWRPVNDSPLLD